MSVPRRTQRKAELDSIEKRVLELLRHEHLTTKVLSERFGLSKTSIKRIAKLENRELDSNDMLTHSETRRAVDSKKIPKYSRFPKRQNEKKEN